MKSLIKEKDYETSKNNKYNYDNYETVSYILYNKYIYIYDFRMEKVIKIMNHILLNILILIDLMIF
jgi:hypothetical protein